LESLNHEAARVKEIQSTYVPREKYDSEIGGIKDRQNRDANAVSNLQGRLIVVGVVTSAAVSAIFFAIASHFIR
jgi:hypothetical protein